MSCAVLLDSGPLGKMVHQGSRYKEETEKLKDYAKQNGISLLIPEIIEIELSKELVQRDFIKSLRELRKFRRQNRVISLIEPDDYDLARLLEEELVKQGLQVSQIIPSTDRVLVAQAIHLKLLPNYDRVIILTENLRHICRLSNKTIEVWSYEQAIIDSFTNEQINTVTAEKILTFL